MNKPKQIINYSIDRIISYSVLSIYIFLIVFGLLSLTNPEWLINISDEDRKIEVSAYINQAVLLSSQHQEYSAIELYDKVLGIVPNYSTAIINKAISLKRLGLLDKSIDLLNSVLKLDKVDSSNVYSNLKDIYVDLKDSLKSELYFLKSIKTTYSELERYMKIANYYLSLKKYDSALVYYNQALNDRFNPETYIKIGILSNSLYISRYIISNNVKMFDGMLFDYESFKLNLSFDKGLAENYNKCGFTLALLGDDESALSFFYKAKAIWSDYRDANLNIRYLIEKRQKMDGK